MEAFYFSDDETWNIKTPISRAGQISWRQSANTWNFLADRSQKKNTDYQQLVYTIFFLLSLPLVLQIPLTSRRIWVNRFHLFCNKLPHQWKGPDIKCKPETEKPKRLQTLNTNIGYGMFVYPLSHCRAHIDIYFRSFFNLPARPGASAPIQNTKKSICTCRRLRLVIQYVENAASHVTKKWWKNFLYMGNIHSLRCFFFHAPGD